MAYSCFYGSTNQPPNSLNREVIFLHDNLEFKIKFKNSTTQSEETEREAETSHQNASSNTGIADRVPSKYTEAEVTSEQILMKNTMHTEMFLLGTTHANSYPLIPSNMCDPSLAARQRQKGFIPKIPPAKLDGTSNYHFLCKFQSAL